jgi:RecB family exonuclease
MQSILDHDVVSMGALPLEPERIDGATYFSFSRLERFQKCAQSYYYKYVAPPEDILPEAPNEHLLKGSLLHSALENYLDPVSPSHMDKEASVIKALWGWLELAGLKVQASEHFYEMSKFAREFAALMNRASARAFEDPIRNKDGSVPRDLQNYPPSSWTKALKDSKLFEGKALWDNWAAAQKVLFNRVSYCYLVGDALGQALAFQLPTWIDKVDSVEMPVSSCLDNHVPVQGLDNAYWVMFIDLICRTNDDRIVLIDHKTSKKKPSIFDVQQHPQLNLYSYAYQHLYGRLPDALGIYHAPSATLVVAKCSPEIVQETVVHHTQVAQRALQTEFICRRHPQEYGAPCIQSDYKSNSITSVCPFLNHCWPNVHQSILQAHSGV